MATYTTREVEVYVHGLTKDDCTGRKANALFYRADLTQAAALAADMARLGYRTLVVDYNYGEWYVLAPVFIDTPSEGDYGWQTIGVVEAGEIEALYGMDLRDYYPACSCCGNYHHRGE